MGFWSSFCSSPAETFPNRLSGDTAVVVPRRWGLLGLLLLVCLIPRVWAAWNWNILWADTIVYLRLSRLLEKGNFAAAFAWLGLNIYPVILLWLRQTGLDWTVAGEWWSVLMASLAVLPLFGWVRRQFDDQVAFAACLLYALQPKLVAFSPLIIRDPTFWFLFNLTLYLAWRAAIEIRWRLFVAAGTALTLTVHTRSEGWILLVPVLLWAAFRLPAVAGSRVRLVMGTVACVAMIPISVTLVNLIWLRDSPHWEMIRSSHVDYARRWSHSFHEPDPDQAAAPALLASKGGQAAEIDPPLASTRGTLAGFTLARKLAVRFVKAYTYVYGLLALVGLWGWWRVYLRRDHQTLLLMSVLLMGAIWIQYSQTGIDIRYFLPIVLVSFPWMALGLLWVPDRIVRLTQRNLTWSPKKRFVLVTGWLVLVAVVGSFSMKLSAGPLMHQRAELGNWIRQRLGPKQRIAGSLKDMRLVGYYAQGHLVGAPRSLAIRRWKPDVIVLRNNRRNRESWAAYSEILEQEAGLRYRRVRQADLPPWGEEILVLVRSEKRF